METDLSNRYLLRDNLLILHLTDWCNNRCRFCMVDKIHSSFSFPYDEIIALVDQLPVGAKVDLFGGEPTLHPNYFDILSHLQNSEKKCSVATNGRAFANPSFTRKTATVTGGELYVRTSLYGLTAKEHDLSTGVKGSFNELMAGIDNIVAAKMTCQVNIVLTRQNISKLDMITRLVASKKVDRIKFGLLVNASSCAEILPRLTEIRPKLIESIHIAKDEGLGVTIEKAPFCLVPEYMNEFSTERSIGKWPRVFDDHGECAGCLMREWCDGLDPDYAENAGIGELTRITQVPMDVTSDFPEKSKDTGVRFLKFNIFRLPYDSFPEDRCREIISGVLEDGKKKFARVAFVPDALIKA